MSLHQAEIIRLNLPARATYLHILSDTIADLIKLVEDIQDSEVVTYNVQLATHEVCTNIIMHSYLDKPNSQNRIDIVLALHPGPLRLEIELRDTGLAFDPMLVPAPNLEETQIHGYGLFLVYSLMDNVNYTTTIGCNHWALIKYL